MASARQNKSMNVIDFVVKQGNGVKGLADMGIETVPSQYIQPLEERVDTSKAEPEDTIPIIDFSKWDHPDVADAIFEAATKWGFFQIINHGVPNKVLADLKAAVNRFFDLPAEEKRKYVRDSPSASARFGTSFSPRAEQVLEWKDYFIMSYVSEDQAFASWPPECRDEAIEYMKTAEVVIRRLLQVLLKSLNVKDIDKETEHQLMGGATRLSFNYYPKCPNPELTAGIGRHSDVSTITVLLQDDSGGLYVRQEGNGADSWIHVSPIDGALVINIGDALQIMSNGQYKSVEHRAIPNKDRSRISVPIFVTPAPTALVGPLPQVLASGEKPVYRQVLYSDYQKHFFGKPHDGKKTIDFAKICN